MLEVGFRYRQRSTGLGYSKSQRISKLLHWFESYGNFAEWVNFAYWISCIGKGQCLQPAHPACYIGYVQHMPKKSPIPIERLDNLGI